MRHRRVHSVDTQGSNADVNIHTPVEYAKHARNSRTSKVNMQCGSGEKPFECLWDMSSARITGGPEGARPP